MAIRIAINGFGRIGRLVCRRAWEDPRFELVAVNDVTDAHTLAHLLKYDSVHRRFPGEVGTKDGHLVIDGKQLSVYSVLDPAELPWKELKVDLVIEATGKFRDRPQAEKHLTAGASRVLISAPAKNPDTTIVMGVNDNEFDPSKHRIISTASCTTNCLAPMAKVLHDSFGIERGFMTTIHAYTSDQRILDLPHKDLRRARAAAMSIIPTTTGAAKAIGLVMPELEGRMNGLAMRVPTFDASLVDLVAVLNTEVTVDRINSAVKEAANSAAMKDYLEYTEDPIVSIDVVGNDHSCIFDAASTDVLGGNLVKVLGWYDNEWGYACRMVDMMAHIVVGAQTSQPV